MAKRPAAAKSKRPAQRRRPSRLEPRKSPPRKKAPIPSAKRAGAAASAAGANRPSGRLIPETGTAIIRMYRIGHGDCFLLALPSQAGADKPVYVMIDCGYKPGSPGKIVPPRSIKDITANIKEATGGHIDLVIITHEHQDHINGLTRANFKNFTFGEAWMAWTEDGSDALANALRKRFKDRLIGLLQARRSLAMSMQTLGAAETESMKKGYDRVTEMLALEIGGEADDATLISAFEKRLGAAAGPGSNAVGNKGALQLVKQLAESGSGTKCLRPHERVLKVRGTADVRAYVLGPPRNEDQLMDLDPVGEEEFHLAPFAAAGGSSGSRASDPPFTSRYAVASAHAFSDARHGGFFTEHYGASKSAHGDDKSEAAPNADWRRIENDWQQTAESLAIAMNDYTNNSSLVVAFELGEGGNVLLFAADAQRGNWLSWGNKTFKDGDKQISARDLLARTVLLKVGHHGSHNGTLNGDRKSEHPSLGWIGTHSNATDLLAAMITAVPAWAKDQPGWNHPLKAIEDALLEKTGGRVFRTDLDQPAMEERRTTDDQLSWDRFLGRAQFHDLYFDYTVPFMT